MTMPTHERDSLKEVEYVDYRLVRLADKFRPFYSVPPAVGPQHLSRPRPVAFAIFPLVDDFASPLIGKSPKTFPRTLLLGNLPLQRDLLQCDECSDCGEHQSGAPD